MKNKSEKSWEKFVMNTITGCNVSFVGFGHIAQTTARLLQKSFNVKIQVLKRTKCKVTDFGDLRVEKVYSFKETDRNNIFKEADFVICSLPGTSETKNFIGEAELNSMKSSSVFISIGRGITVDEDALVKALNKKSIFGAALDVFHEEPLPKTSPLWNCPNLLISPHNADFTEDYFQLGWKVFEANLEQYLKDESLVTEADISLGY